MSSSRMVRMSVEYDCSFGFLAFVEEIVASLEASIDGTVVQEWHSDNLCAIDVGGTRIAAAYEDETLTPEGVPCLTLSLGENGVDAGPCLLRQNRDDFLTSIQRLLAQKGKVRALMVVDFNSPFTPTTFQEMRKMAQARMSNLFSEDFLADMPDEAPDSERATMHPFKRILPRRVKAQATENRDRCVRLGTVHLTTTDDMAGRKAKLYSNGTRLVQMPDTIEAEKEAISKWALRSTSDPVSLKPAKVAKSLGQIAAASLLVATLSHAAAAASLATFGG